MELLNKLPYPTGFSKNEILDVLFREEYGYLPKKPDSVTVNVDNPGIHHFAGKGYLARLSLTIHAEFGEFTFPFYYVYPLNAEKKVPAFIHINFRDGISDRYQPTEEILDRGYAVLTFCYENVTSDNSDFTNGLAGLLYKDGKRTPDACGKIGLWAYAASALLDYAVTLPELDADKISVVGHSRLGKTALLAGAIDERFYCAISNDSGCGGATLARENTGETIRAINKNFPFWFCENYKKYIDNEDSMPFDQHWLIAANHPHRAYVASAEGDTWACPKNEYLACVAASRYYEEKGKIGFVPDGNAPKLRNPLHEGMIGHHMRPGLHFLSREDWNFYIDYLDKQFSKDEQ